MSVSGIPEAFTWLQYAIENLKPPPPSAEPGNDQHNDATATSVLLKESSGEVLSEKLDSWLSRADNDSTPEEFLAQFDRFDLPAWDHYTHIRVAYVILTTYGRQKGEIDRIYTY